LLSFFLICLFPGRSLKFRPKLCGNQCCGFESGSVCFWASWIQIRIH
jgi:hypothetical protein